MRKVARRLIIIIFCTLSAIILSIVGINYYIDGIQSALWKQSVSEIMEVAAQGSHAVEVYIQKDLLTLARICKHLSADGKISADDNHSEFVNEVIDLFEEDDITFSVIDFSDKIMYGGTKRTPYLLSDAEFASYSALTGKSAREPFIDEYTGRSTVGGYDRFTFSDGCEGLAQVKRRLSVVSEEFTLTFYNETGFSYVVNAAGDIVWRSMHKNSNHTFTNICNVVEESGNSDEDVSALKQCIATGKRGAAQLLLNNIENVIAFMPVQNTPGWMLIAIVPKSEIMSQADGILKTQQTAAVSIVVVIIIATLFILFECVSSRRIVKRETDIVYREQLFDTLAKETNDVYIMFRTDNYAVEYVSPNTQRVLGISGDKIKANIHILDGDMRAPEKDAKAMSRLDMEGCIIFENERKHGKTGEVRYFHEALYKKNINNEKRYIAVLSDRTLERQREQVLKNALDIAKSANEAKSNFLSNMSHDIRTPMNAIIGFATLIAKDADQPDRVRDCVRKITVSGQHLLGLINDILDMSKIESGKTVLHIEEFSLPEFLNEVNSMIAPVARAKLQTFEIHSKGNLPEIVSGDKLRINQVMLNLLSNAIKYTPEHGKIEMRIEELPNKVHNCVHLRVDVEDNGIGMSEQFVSHIFEPFVREETGAARGIQGSGLGMTITKHIIDLMGGTISVKSTLGKGSTFTVELELMLGSKMRTDDKDFWKRNNVSRALVVDDEEDVCIGVCSLLSETGLDISYVLNGKSAIERTKEASATKKPFDIIILDLQMPGMDGIETARGIRKIVGPNVPILVLTSYSFDDIEDEAKEAGIDLFIPKPFFVSNLRKAVEQFHNGNRATDACDDESVFEGRKVLVVEDNEVNVEIFTDLLSAEGADCDVANNGKEGLDKFAESPEDLYDIIFMDLQMPVMNGCESARAIRACNHPRAQTIPIIAMTANAFDDDVKASLDSGMNAHLSKPIDMRKVKEVTARYIGKRRDA